MRKILITTIFLVLICGFGCAKSVSAGEDNAVPIKSNFKSSVNNDFGKATIKLIDKKQYKLACSDAKMLYTMLYTVTNSARNSVKNKDNLSYIYTPAELEVKNAIDSFANQLAKYKDNEEAMINAMNILDTGVFEILKLITVKDAYHLTNDEVDEYIDIELCGKKAPKGWVSPVEKFFDQGLDRKITK